MFKYFVYHHGFGHCAIYEISHEQLELESYAYGITGGPEVQFLAALIRWNSSPEFMYGPVR